MKKSLFGIFLLTVSFGAIAACPGSQQSLIIAGENMCGMVSPATGKGIKAGAISITMPAGPDSQLYKLHKNQLNKLKPGIFKDYVEDLKKDEIPVGVSHAISSVKFAADSLPQYANKTYDCDLPHINEAPKGNVSSAILLIPNCVLAAK
ncbi:hypothetical protein LZG75_01050 [Polynucleobacter sp. IMCC30063]|uniref:hypothetical protein n=1 Tax=Polynucleobacter sp. IMCC30063 TaxID=2907298 RepID=UPI001F2C1EFD|nr:hypothetical protein [Polynucleobacter sp. IMCC30063]MCE7504824.1 hypothetical protein [Polynucleobacter sp. IMCC30063]